MVPSTMQDLRLERSIGHKFFRLGNERVKLESLKLPYEDLCHTTVMRLQH